MPRNGDGSGDNAIEAGHNIVHGVNSDNTPVSSGVDRSHKAAAHPGEEKGEALEGMNASGGGSSAAHIGDHGDGKGPKVPGVEKEASKQ